MTTIADLIAQTFGHRYDTFDSPEAGHIANVCASQANHVIDEFGKRKFVFSDHSAIAMGDGRWFVGFGDCFCNAAQGHHPECPGSRVADVKHTPPPVHATKAMAPEASVAAVPSFIIHLLGEEAGSVVVNGSQHKARVEARALLTRAKRATMACLVDQGGDVTDAYERLVSRSGEVKIKKMDPKKLPESVRASLLTI